MPPRRLMRARPTLRGLSAFARFACDRRGVAATIVALAFGALVTAGAVSIDLGSIFLDARRLQGMADLAAMSAAQGLTSSTTDAQDIQNAQAAAAGTVGVNAWPFTDPAATAGAPQVAAVVTPGVYTPDPNQPASRRFTPATVSPNAAKVTLTAPVRLLFLGVIFGDPVLHISRSATAASAQLAAFSIGSGLASLNGGLANTLLSALTGSQVQLSAVSYTALLGANVDLLTYLNALSTRLSLTGGSYNSLLAGNVAMPTALAALGDALGVEGQGAAATAINQLVAVSASAPAVQLSTLLDLGPYGAQDHGGFATGGAAVSLNAMSMVTALLTAANGQHQLQLNLGTQVPGLAGLTAYLAIGQRPSHSPWISITQSQDVIVRTAQARIYLQASVASSTGVTSAVQGVLSGLGSLLNGVGSLLGGSSSSSSASSVPGLVNLSAYVELASAQARLSALHCAGDPTQDTVSLQVLPSLGTVAVASVNTSTLGDFTAPVQLNPVPLLSVPNVLTASIYASTTLGGGQAAWQTVSFSGADIQNHAVKTVSTPDLVQATLASLLGSTSVSIAPLGGSPLTVSTSPLQSSLSGLLTPVGGLLDGVVDQLTGLLGVQLGTASVWSDGLRCQGAALVA